MKLQLSSLNDYKSNIFLKKCLETTGYCLFKKKKKLIKKKFKSLSKAI